jgi:lipopolysaccharide/colanic/teichoic acid biosynthesis glycosyltransferase
MQHTIGNQPMTSGTEARRPALAVGGAQSSAILPPLARSRSAREAERARRQVREISTRILNVAVALFLIALTLPLMAAIAVLVKLGSPGPVLYAQDRVGLNRREGDRRRGPRRFQDNRRASDRGGKIFRIYKFRTMRPANGDDPQVWAARQDPRITKVGRFLRAHRLDELPQLFNVVKGDMNLVGPRPEQPEIFDELRQAIQLYSQRQAVRPGITGWAQVNHRYDETIADVRKKLLYDLDYVKRQSVSKDLLIMAKTPSVMLFKQGSR